MRRVVTPTRSLIFLVFLSGILLFSLSAQYDLLDGTSSRHHLARRQLGVGGAGNGTPGGGAGGGQGGGAGGGTPGNPDTQPDNPNTNPDPNNPNGSTPNNGSPPNNQGSSKSAEPSKSPAPNQSPASKSDDASKTPDPSASGSASADPNSKPSQSPAQSPPSDTPTPTPTPTPSPPPQQQPSDTNPFVTDSVFTAEDGSKQTVFVTVTPTPTPSTPVDSTTDDSKKSKGVGTSTIVGLSVAGGVAVICIIAFIVWKFTRKRFSDDFEDNDGIKWPELNTHGNDNPHALPTNRTLGSGFETTSEVNLTRPDSRAGSFAASTSESNLYSTGQDPYAVPPLPHLNPNQPYRDDPGSYYDPYSGPVPQTFSDTAPHDGEVIPMTQIGRARSPGPQMALGDAASIRARSPGPQAGYDMMAGRASPGPQAALAPMDRGRSPGPGAAYGVRSTSPGPQAAYGYGAYGGAPAGRASPGPHQAYGS